MGGGAGAGEGTTGGWPSGAQAVTVVRDRAVRAEGVRWRGVVAYDWGFDDADGSHRQRSFVLLDDGVQINQPVRFPPEQRDWWYCDLVSVVEDDRVVQVDDLWIDFVVGPPDHPYRVLDLDEYADALSDGRLALAQAADGLRRAQTFLDRRLNRRYDTKRVWPDFPPDAVMRLMTTELPASWSRIDS
jgi:hypothetical protein